MIQDRLPRLANNTLVKLVIAMLFGTVIIDILATISLHFLLHWPISGIKAWPQALAGVYVAAEYPWYVLQHGITSLFGLTALEDQLIEPYQGTMPIEMLAIALPVLWILLSYISVLWLSARTATPVAYGSSASCNTKGLLAGMGFVLLYVVVVLFVVHIAVDIFALIGFKLLAR